MIITVLINVLFSLNYCGLICLPGACGVGHQLWSDSTFCQTIITFYLKWRIFFVSAVVCVYQLFNPDDTYVSKYALMSCLWLTFSRQVNINIPVRIAAMGLSSQRVPAEEANRQRSVLHCGNQDCFGQGVRHGVPGKRWVDWVKS